MHARVRRPQSADDDAAGDAVGSSQGASILPFEGSVESRERFYRALLEQTRDLITVVDRNGTIMFRNRSTEQTLGYSPAELVGRNVFEFIHPDDQDRVRQAFEQALDGADVPAIEHRFRYKDGSWRVLESIGRYSRDLPFGPIGIVNSREITERKSIEAQFRRAQRMEVLGRMASTVAHDFRNVLAVINASADRLLEGNPSPNVRRRATELVEAVQHADAWTRRLLMFSRDEAVAAPQVVNVNQVLIELAGFLHQLVGTNIGLALALGASSSWITIDRVLLEQVIVNLVLNARDAMPSGGVVTIATKNLARPDAAGPELRCVAIEVTDTGVGMTQEVRERIFEPFFTTKGSEKGSGLGLSAVFSVVHQAGGRIDVDTQQGRGTTFRVTLPGRPRRQEGERTCNSPSGSPRAW
jgi:PAS domain S-box-containing protein